MRSRKPDERCGTARRKALPNKRLEQSCTSVYTFTRGVGNATGDSPRARSCSSNARSAHFADVSASRQIGMAVGQAALGSFSWVCYSGGPGSG